MARVVLESGGVLFMVSVLLKASVLLGGAALVVLLMRGASAAARHLVWSVAVAGTLVLPVGALLLQSSRVVLPVPFIVRGSEPAAAWTGAGAAGQQEPIVLDAEPAAAAHTMLLPAADLSSAEAAFTQTPGPQRNWMMLALAVWLLGVALSLSTLLASTLRVLRLQRRSRRVDRGPLVLLTAQLAARLKLKRAPRLHLGDAQNMPMVWGFFRPVLLLPEGAASWPESRLRAVLLHELAHVRRRDAFTQLLAELARALYWCNPLVWLAARQLYLEREHACDDVVLSAGTRPSEYAGELLDLVRTLRSTRATSLAAIAMARPGQLKARLHAVLDEARSHRTLSRVFGTTTVLLALIFVLPLAALQPVLREASAEADIPILPVSRSEAAARQTLVTASAQSGRRPAQTQDQPVLPELSFSAEQIRQRLQLPALDAAPPPVSAQLPAAIAQLPAQQDNCGRARSQNISHNDNDGVETIRWSRGQCSGSARIEGTVRFTDDFDGVLSLSSGGLFRLEEDDGDVERRVEIRAVRGDLEYRYRVNGRDAEFDASGRVWFRRALLTLVRTTGFAADQRVAHLLRTRGADGVLSEVQLIQSDYVQSVYLRRMLENADLSAAQVKSSVDLAGREIESDYELARVLMALSGKHQFSDETRRAFITATASIESDYEQRRVLSTALNRGGLNSQDVTAMLGAAENIGSDYERATLLIGLAERYRLDPAMRTAYLKAAQGIGSDYEQRRVYGVLLKQGSLNSADMAALLAATTTINSDYEKAQTLLALTSNDLSDPALQTAFLKATRDMSSSYEQRRVLTSLLAKESLSAGNLNLALQSAAQIDSDHELSQVLQLVLEKHTLNAEQKELFMKALNTIQSEYEYGRVATRLLRTGR